MELLYYLSTSKGALQLRTTKIWRRFVRKTIFLTLKRPKHVEGNTFSSSINFLFLMLSQLLFAVAAAAVSIIIIHMKFRLWSMKYLFRDTLAKPPTTLRKWKQHDDCSPNFHIYVEQRGLCQIKTTYICVFTRIFYNLRTKHTHIHTLYVHM